MIALGGLATIKGSLKVPLQLVSYRLASGRMAMPVFEIPSITCKNPKAGVAVMHR